MRLRLPEPLPYDVVDEMIDATCHFEKNDLPYTDNGVSYEAVEWFGRRNTNHYDHAWHGNFVRPMFSLVVDVRPWQEEEAHLENWQGDLDSMVWTAKELTDKEIDEILGLTQPSE